MSTVVTDPDDPRLRDFIGLTDVALRRRLDVERGLYLAEGLKICERALAAGHRVRAVMTIEKTADRVRELLARHPDLTGESQLCVVSRELAETVTGFDMHRGVIASVQRPALPTLGDTLAEARRVVVLDGLSDHSNVGLAFRSAAALGADAVLLTPSCADPWYRRAVRLSMGAVFHVPWTRIPDWPEAGPALKGAGFHLVAFALRDDAVTLEEFVQNPPPKYALIFGNEGHGLGFRALGAADTVVTIPMAHGVDSLNVATTTAVALWAMRSHERGRQ